MTTLVVPTAKCVHCGEAGSITVDAKGYEEWKAGAFIQNALPELSADEREQLLTGTHGSCFDIMFPEEEEEYGDWDEEDEAF